MTAVLKLYNGKTYGAVANVATDILHLEFRVGLEGSASGTIEVAIDSGNDAVLRSLKENSHFLAFSLDGVTDIVGGVVDQAYCTDDTCKITFIGFLEYLDKIVACSSYRAGQLDSNVVIPEEDASWEKTFLADSAPGLMYEIFNNLKSTMAIDGFSPFWEWNGIMASIHANSTNTWKKNYRLNSAEFPTMKSIVEDIASDADCPRFDVEAETAGGSFRWKLSFQTTQVNITFNTATAPVYEVAYEFAGLPARSSSVAKGQTIKGEAVLSKLAFNSSVAYSHYVADDTSDGSTADAQGINRKNIASLKNLSGQVSYKTQDPSLARISANVTISTDTRVTRMVVSEVSFDGKEFTVTGNTVSSSENLSALKLNKPANPLSGTLRKPLTNSFNNARKSVFSEKRKTGWRTL